MSTKAVMIQTYSGDTWSKYSQCLTGPTFSWFSLVPPDKCWVNNLNYNTVEPLITDTLINDYLQ
jgi:hypothetical protein